MDWWSRSSWRSLGPPRRELARVAGKVGRWNSGRPRTFPMQPGVKHERCRISQTLPGCLDHAIQALADTGSRAILPARVVMGWFPYEASVATAPKRLH